MVTGMRQLEISGEVLTDTTALQKYASDMSHYSLLPKVVAFPRNEEDLSAILAYAMEEKVPLTPRGAGSNQSGSSVGSGILTLFTKMNAVLSRQGNRVRVQPGVIHQQLDQQLHKERLKLPYDPSSRMFCTIGGNVATKASGLRSLKYGNVDAALKKARFLDPAHGLVDTSKPLPADLEKAILQLKEKLHSDRKALQVLEAHRNVKSSSGYNLTSLIDYEAVEDIVTHLMAGSVGTLGVFSEIELEAIAAPANTRLYLMFFRSLAEAAADVPKLKAMNPSAIEVIDSYGVDLLQAKTGLEVPGGSECCSWWSSM
jgi:glycolate oxidase